MATSRTLYHTHIKYLAFENLLSTEILKQIPRTTLSRWRHENPDRYQSFDLNLRATADYELLHHFSNNQTAKRIYHAYVRLGKTVLTIAHSVPGFHQQVKAQSKQIVELVSRVRNAVGLKRTLRFFNISVPTFRNWSAQSAAACFESLTNTCIRIFHNQLSQPEVLKLKELATGSQFPYWPISSIALYALRNNLLSISLPTWYKYVNKFDLMPQQQRSRRKKNAVSVRATRPHEIWHADITSFITADNAKRYIYFVVDNFSRKILSWLIADKVKATYRKATIEEALNHVRVAYHEVVTLITDGGPENKFENFTSITENHIEHKIALVDVHYSNSLVEASFKTIKYNYLYRMDIKDGGELHKALDLTVNNFNNRPHISLNGLTPNEASQNVLLNKTDLTLTIKNATLARKKYNTLNRCTQCK